MNVVLARGHHPISCTLHHPPSPLSLRFVLFVLSLILHPTKATFSANISHFQPLVWCISGGKSTLWSIQPCPCFSPFITGHLVRLKWRGLVLVFFSFPVCIYRWISHHLMCILCHLGLCSIPLFLSVPRLSLPLSALCLSDRHEVNVIHETRQLVLPEYSIVSFSTASVRVREWICTCVHVWPDIHRLILSTEVLRGCGRQKLVPQEPPLLAVNNTNRDHVPLLSSSSHPTLVLSFSSFLSFHSPSYLFFLYILIPSLYLFIYSFLSIHPSVLQPFLPFLLSSPDG